MDNTRPDILGTLKSEEDWLVKELRRVRLAISAYEGNLDEPCDKQQVIKPKPTLIRRRAPIRKRGAVQWADEIRKVFDELDEVTPADVIEQLTKNGVENLDDKNIAKSVYATLARKVTNGELYKRDGGKYCKKK
jgi:hypothetical protein